MELPTIWFCIVSVMVAMYVVFDGFDLGAGIVHLFVAKTDSERRAITRSIGPVWDGNEVWLLAAGGVLYFAFPAVYARSFSGFYLPLMMVLWLLILRAIALELRGHIEGPVWQPLWDRVFGLASGLLTVFFGAALGNVVRGVPMNEDGQFFEPMWTDFTTTGETGILDWYTVLVGVTAAVTLAVHGGNWVVYKTEGDLQARTRAFVRRLWIPLGVLVALVTWATFVVQPHVPRQMMANAWGFVFPVVAIGSYVGMRRLAERGQDKRAFYLSSLFIVGMLTSAVFGLFPYLLPSNTDPSLGLTAHNAAAPTYGLKVGLMWWIPGMILVTIYFTYVYRQFAGKVET